MGYVPSECKYCKYLETNNLFLLFKMDKNKLYYCNKHKCSIITVKKEKICNKINQLNLFV